MAPEKKADNVQLDERRHFIRHPLCFPLTYRVLEKNTGGDKHDTAKTVNISNGGLLFSARKPVSLNTRIETNVPFLDKVFRIKARVVHCDRNTETKFYNIGVSFDKMSDAFKAKLVEQLYRISEFRDLWSMQEDREVTFAEASEEWIKRYAKRFNKLYPIESEKPGA